MSLIVGDIVVGIGGKDYFKHHHRQGIVKKIIEVNGDLIIHISYDPWTIARKLFEQKLAGYTILVYAQPYSIEKCACKGCRRKAVIRAMIKLPGTVYEVDLCEKHKEQYHGKSLPDFPWRDYIDFEDSYKIAPRT